MNISDQDIALFNYTLKSITGFDFSDYSDKSLRRRITKLLVDHNIDMPGLIKKIRENTQFIASIVNEITVNTTELFRDPDVWQIIKYQILPKFANQKNINIWHAGCSTGQEVYSMLILLKETGFFDRARVYASDINTDVIEQAKKGVYKYRFNINYLDNFDKALKENPFNYEELIDVPYNKYFIIDKEKDNIIMLPFLREKTMYKQHNLISNMNPFPVKFDIILCRNVIIYFNYKLQNQIIKFFLDNLHNNGFLILGKQESVRGLFAGSFERTYQAYVKKQDFNSLP